MFPLWWNICIYGLRRDTSKRINGSDDTCLLPVCIHISTELLCCCSMFFLLSLLFTFVSTTLDFRRCVSVFFFIVCFSSGQGCKVVNVHFACRECFIGQRGGTFVAVQSSATSNRNRFGSYVFIQVTDKRWSDIGQVLVSSGVALVFILVQLSAPNLEWLTK